MSTGTQPASLSGAPRLKVSSSSGPRLSLPDSVDHDLHLTSGEGLDSGDIAFRTEDRLVHVTWGDVTWDNVDPDVPGGGARRPSRQAL